MEPVQGNPQFFLKREDGTIVPLIAISGFPTSVARPASSFHLPCHAANPGTDGLFEPCRPQVVLEASAMGQAIESSTVALSPKEQSCSGASRSSGFGSRSGRSAYTRLPVKSFGIQEQPLATVPRSAPVRQPLGPPATPVLLPAALPSPAAIATPVDHRPRLSPSPVLDSKPGATQPLPPWHRLSNLALKPAPGVKEYCSYWLRNGECDYSQQGCLYKHEMPFDQATLERVGLRDIPRWYREKHGLGSYLAVSGAKGGMSLAERSKKKDKEEMMMDRNWRSYGRRASAAGARKRAGPASIPRSSSSSQRDDQNAAPATATATAPALNEREKQLRKTIAELQEWETTEKRRRAAAAEKYADTPTDQDHTDTDGVVHVRSERKTDTNIETPSRPSAAAASTTASEATTATAVEMRRASTSSSDDEEAGKDKSTRSQPTRRHRLAAARGGKAAAAASMASPSILPGAAAAVAAPKPSRRLAYRGRIGSSTSAAAAVSVSGQPNTTPKAKQVRREASPDRLSVVSDREFNLVDRDGWGRTGASRDISLDEYDHDD
ncbi:hypothetical protein DV735_g4106, partial [Chaetothyriales sp. CBS 134920]